MPEIVRFTVSLEDDLLAAFDAYVLAGRFATRSEAIRQLLRERLTNAAVEAEATDVAASLTLVYDHHRSNLTHKMVELQHRHGDLVVSAMHVHLTHDLCMELIALHGPAAGVQQLAAELGGLKGVHQSQCVIARAVAGGQAAGHDHPHPHPH